MRQKRWSWLALFIFIGAIAFALWRPTALPAKQEEEEPDMIVYKANNPATDWQWPGSDLPADRWCGVLESRQQMAALLTERPYMQERLPQDINWEKEVLVVATLGAAPTGGYAIRINRITANLSLMQVQVAMKGPAPSDIVIQMITYPVDSIRLLRSSLGQSEVKWQFVDQTGRQIGPYPSGN